MEISRRRSLSLDFEASPAASSHPPTYADCRRSDMYSLQGSKPFAERRSAKPFLVTSSLSMDSGERSTLVPKKENFISNMFNIFTNALMDIAKVPGSFTTSYNNTLSVTVVPNEGIISQDFFKTLTRNGEQLVSEQQGETRKAVINIADILPSKSLSDYSEPFRTKEVSVDNQRIKETSEPSEVRFSCEDSQNKLLNDKQITMKGLSSQKAPLVHEDVGPSLDVAETNVKEMREIKEPCSSRSAVPEAEVPSKTKEAWKGACSTGWQMWQKVVGGIPDRFKPMPASPDRFKPTPASPDRFKPTPASSDRFKPRPVSPDSEVPTKKPNLAIYPHAKPRRKTCTVARGRGKGRGKSQLRRSGVSQSRHRKERTKQNIYSNIHDDLEALEDFEYCDFGSDDVFQGTQSEDQRSPSHNDCLMLFENFTFVETHKLGKRKQRVSEGNVACPLRVRYLPESPMDIDEHEFPPRAGFRPRLISESSVDSEDSYCIVFESSSDSEYTDYDYDSVSEEDLDEEFESNKTSPRVRFNLEPQIHKMVQWDYAYRAARRGPWEEMARDRDRFRGRIRCTERILEPILAPQHRKSVWQDRFSVDG